MKTQRERGDEGKKELLELLRMVQAFGKIEEATALVATKSKVSHDRGGKDENIALHLSKQKKNQGIKIKRCIFMTK